MKIDSKNTCELVADLVRAARDCEHFSGFEDLNDRLNRLDDCQVTLLIHVAGLEQLNRMGQTVIKEMAEGKA